MRHKVVALAIAGTLGVGGIAAAAPSFAAGSGTTHNPLTDRITAIKDALKSLVSDKTITQQQADKVATTLAGKLPDGHDGHGFGRFGGHGPGRGLFGAPADVAKAVGVTAETLRTALEGGQTLAQVAQAHGISKSTLIDRLVTAAQTRLAAAVKDGRLTAAQAAGIRTDLRARITDMVDRVDRGRPGGPGGRDFPGAPPASAPGASGTTGGATSWTGAGGALSA